MLFEHEGYIPEEEQESEARHEGDIEPYEVGLPGDQITVADDSRHNQLEVLSEQDNITVTEKTEEQFRSLIKEYSDDLQAVGGENITDEKLRLCDQHFLITPVIAKELSSRLAALEYTIDEIADRGFIAEFGDKKIAFILTAEKSDSQNS